MSVISSPGDIPPAPPRPYGKYFLVRKVAEGGMAEIFLAKQVGQEGFERNVVIKRMLSNLSSSPEFVTMFLDEARLAARLSHPNIVQIHDLGHTDGCYYICMEYLAGEDFSTVLRSASKRRDYVPMGLVLRVLIDAAHGLHYAHEFSDDAGNLLHVVHRDISPSNIFVTYVGQVKLLDFGIAKAESRATQTTAGVVKGKYMYMAPEQARGEKVDRRADVFSLGVSLYEALTNTRPFARDAELAILNAVLTSDFRPPRELRPEIPPALEAVVLKAMSGPMEKRHASAAELAADLERLVDPVPLSTAQVSEYLRSLFGRERIALKTRIPTLSTLLSQAGSSAESSPLTPSRSTPQPRSEHAQEMGTVVTRTPGARATEARPKYLSSPSQWLFLAGGLGLGTLVALGVFFGVRHPSPVPLAMPEVARPGVTNLPVEAQARLPNPEAPTASPAPIPRSAVPTPAPVAPASVPPEVTPPESEAKHFSRPARRAELVELNADNVQKILNRSSGPIRACFETFMRELPGEEGQVAVTFTILGNGKVVNAKVASAFSGTKVGRCVEQRVAKVRFPAHKDKEISLTLPFGYHRVGG